ncbi:MAG: hypothetical protein EA397_07950 [Deltaproteobacteria bacterium]|nr:MAG: hypothetical protein EA397_07950 [Deltaproteobacteria bacterium]
MLLLLSLAAFASDVDVSRESPHGSARMVSMGGAFRAISEGAMAQTLNPAAIAVRPRGHDRDDWMVDGMAVAGGVVPYLRSLNLEDLAGAPLPTLDLQAGAVFGRHGRAGAITLGTRTLNDAASERRTVAFEVAAGGGWSSPDDQVQLGAMIGLVSVRTRLRGAEGPDLATVVPSLAGGARWVVPNSRVRLGISGQSPWRQRVEAEQVSTVSQPWRLGVGGAVARGERSRGLRPQDREPMPTYVLGALDLVAIGAQRGTTALSDWTRAAPRGLDAPVSLAVHLGGEVEVIPYWLRVRAGAYTDPPRLRDDRTRVHGTLGLDVATFEIPLLGLRLTLLPHVDVSGLGVQPGLGLGGW